MDKISLWKKFIGTPSYQTFQKSVKHLSSHEYDGVIYEYYLQANGLGGDGKTTFQEVVLSCPKNLNGKTPAVVVPFYYPEQMLGFNPKTGEKNDYYFKYPFAHELSKLGFITITAQSYHLTYIKTCLPDRPSMWKKSGEALLKNNPNWSGVGKLVSDTQLLIDILCEDDRVDSEKIGIMGHSLGGKIAFYTGCLDERIKVIVASDFGILFDQTNWQDVWYWGDKLQKIKNNNLSHNDLLEYANCKPFCLIAGLYDNDDSKDFLYSINDYKNCSDRLLVINHKTGHNPPLYAREEGYNFIKHWLLKEKN